jgi:hypothetical protein
MFIFRETEGNQIDTTEVQNTGNNKALRKKQNWFCLILFSYDLKSSAKESEERRNFKPPSLNESQN